MKEAQPQKRRSVTWYDDTGSGVRSGASHSCLHRRACLWSLHSQKTLAQRGVPGEGSGQWAVLRGEKSVESGVQERRGSQTAGKTQGSNQRGVKWARLQRGFHERMKGQNRQQRNGTGQTEQGVVSQSSQKIITDEPPCLAPGKISGPSEEISVLREMLKRLEGQ